jgi:hypothetical protein
MVAATLGVLVVSALLSFAPTIGQVSFRMVWNGATPGYTNFVPGSNWCWNAYMTTNLGTAQSNWPFAFAITNWDLGPTFVTNGMTRQWQTSAVMTFSPAQYFMYISPSNFNGVGVPSNPTFNPALAADAEAVGLSK